LGGRCKSEICPGFIYGLMEKNMKRMNATHPLSLERAP
jgi:hypothetical protein